MKMKKRQIIPFSFYDITGMERHLEGMAAKGWMLDKITGMGWCYVRCQPKQVHFGVTYYPRASAFEPEPSEGQKTLEEFCDHAGWRLVGSSAQLLVFANEGEDPVPIHTDPELELEGLERIAKRNLLLWGLMAVLSLWQLLLIWSQFRFNPVWSLSSSMSIFSGLTMLYVLLYMGAEVGGWYRWRKKARAAAEQGEFVPTHGHEKMGYGMLPWLLLGVCYVLLSSHGSVQGQIFVILLPSSLALGAAVQGTRIALQKRKVSTRRNRALTLLVDVVLSAALMAGLMLWVLRAEPFQDRTGEMVLTVESLTGESNRNLVQELTTSNSFLLARTDGYQMVEEMEQKVDQYLRYQILDTPFDWIYVRCLEELLHQYNHYGDDEPDWSEEKPFYIYQPVDPTPWGAEAAYQLQAYGEEKSKYLICWADRIVELEPSWLLNGEETARAAAALAP